MPPSQAMLKALTAPAVVVSPLMTAILVHTTHLFFNSLLLSPWNPTRCAFWNQESCSDKDVVWMLNWFAYAKFHLAVLLGCLGSSSIGVASIESKLGFLSLSILMCYLAEGIMSLKHFNAPMAIFQAIILVVLMLVILFWISSEELRPGSAYLASAYRSRSLSQSQRRTIAIPTVTLSIQAFLSVLRVVDMAFGSTLQGGYLGDDSRYVLVYSTCRQVKSMLLHPFMDSCIHPITTYSLTIPFLGAVFPPKSKVTCTRISPV